MDRTSGTGSGSIYIHRATEASHSITEQVERRGEWEEEGWRAAEGKKTRQVRVGPDPSSTTMLAAMQGSGRYTNGEVILTRFCER